MFFFYRACTYTYHEILAPVGRVGWIHVVVIGIVLSLRVNTVECRKFVFVPMFG